MLLYVIFGQRRCRYEGEYAPEALEIVDEYTMEENPEWIETKKKEHAEDKSFSNVEIVTIDLGKGSLDKISKILNQYPTVEGSVVNE